MNCFLHRDFVTSFRRARGAGRPKDQKCERAEVSAKANKKSSQQLNALLQVRALLYSQ
jgi:hypothetical protein